ncbi:hypothetical protein ACVBEJ_14455 [Porticoccus sp. GXU_MW_L64]
MREYSAYLIFKGVDENRLLKIGALARKSAIEVDFGENFLEFEFSGRDTDKQIVKYCVSLAEILGDAEGEIVCEIINDEGDNEFEFYRIKNNKLIRQLGRIVRNYEEVVTMK